MLLLAGSGWLLLGGVGDAPEGASGGVAVIEVVVAGELVGAGEEFVGRGGGRGCCEEEEGDFEGEEDEV